MAKHSNPDTQFSNSQFAFPFSHQPNRALKLITKKLSFAGSGYCEVAFISFWYVFLLSKDDLEPPDIRNWFSSYVYESPEFNTGDDFEGYPLRRSEFVEEGFYCEEKSKEMEENLGVFRKIRNKDELVLGSSDSLSLSSEPPDITRWFSSYAYESPVLDTSDDFKGSIFTESGCERVGCNAENCSKEKGENLMVRRITRRDLLAADEKISSNGIIKCNSSDRDNEYDHHRYNSKDINAVEGNKTSSINDLPVKMVSGQVLEGKPTRKHNVDSTQNVEKPSLDGQGENREANIMSLNTNRSSGTNNSSSQKMLTHSRDSVDKNPAQTEKHGVLARVLDLIKVNGNSIRKPTCGSNDKENDGNMFAENGFISTRNNRRARPNDDSSLKRSMEVQFDRLRGKVTDSSVEKEAIRRRKPLSETTNFQNTDVSLGITGKWNCPQKSKPNLGPPLKQLRLEKWVHRV
ncbi:hypothetical protein LOK49_LG11G02287 [Camellia lanceoleosa]|uniref:Uncharacterized protein n=1 Tax=Camellia lanceoleosa TaxID=1840588 RepID=A0ACC0G0C9_9ERIC|nr:hypothetical protein LOK49_LG11G02287 [Camellia lanceoleosa]